MTFQALFVVFAIVHSLPFAGVLPPASGPTRSTELPNGNTSAVTWSSTDRSLSSGTLTAT